MHLDLTPEQTAFRNNVRAFLEEKFTSDLRELARRQAGVFAEPAVGREWHRILFEQGWIAPSWPKEYGGPGWSPVERYIFAAELAAVGAPALASMGISLCGPVIMRYGSKEQKDRFLPRMLSGEDYWCQGYSEPQSGSDLASLRTRAVLDGDAYVIDGSKIWTTHAQFCNWIFMLVRTSNEGPKQAGISFIVAPMDLPGISISPIISMSGEHEVNQVFFDSVRVPVENLIGDEGQGWEVAKYLLEFERGGGVWAGMVEADVKRLQHISSIATNGFGGTLADDAYASARIARAEIAGLAAEWTERRLTFSSLDQTRMGDMAASIKKLGGSERGQDLQAALMDTLGPYALASQQDALGADATQAPIGPDYGTTLTAKFLNGRASSIYGGAAEVQRNILARSLLAP